MAVNTLLQPGILFFDILYCPAIRTFVAIPDFPPVNGVSDHEHGNVYREGVPVFPMYTVIDADPSEYRLNNERADSGKYNRLYPWTDFWYELIEQHRCYRHKRPVERQVSGHQRYNHRVVLPKTDVDTNQVQQ